MCLFVNQEKMQARTKQKNTGRTKSVADIFATAFVPEPAFLEKPK